MPAEVVVMYDCASNFATYEVPGSSGNTYDVTLGGETYAHCPCTGFGFRKDCSHVKYVWDHACLYNPQWHDGKENPDLVPKEYERTVGFNEKVRCPACGGPSVAVRRAV
jgi:hypothetical protein